MITTLKDELGKVIAFCEWRLVSKSGFDKIDGEYVWVNDTWIHPDYSFKRLNRLIDEVMSKVPPSAKYAYFLRGKYKDRMKMFSRKYWEKRRQAYAPIEKEI